jgi:transposase
MATRTLHAYYSVGHGGMVESQVLRQPCHLTGDVSRRHGRDDWSRGAQCVDAAVGLPELRPIVTGLRRDQDAVTAGLTLRWSSGAVGGHINRIKMLKRQMYGRANPDLLRLRVLLAD